MNANMILKPSSDGRTMNINFNLAFIDKDTHGYIPKILDADKLREGLDTLCWVECAKVSEDGAVLIEAKNKEYVYNRLSDGTSPICAYGWILYNYPEETLYEPKK